MYERTVPGGIPSTAAIAEGLYPLSRISFIAFLSCTVIFGHILPLSLFYSALVCRTLTASGITSVASVRSLTMKPT